MNHVKRRKPPPLKHRIMHAVFTAIRIIAVIVGMHYLVGILELHHVFSKLGKTGEFLCGSVLDYLLFGVSEGSGGSA